MIRKTTTFAKLLAACPCIQLKDDPIVVAAWLEARLAKKGIQLSIDPTQRYRTVEK